MSGWDDYFWPGESVLRNKLNEHDHDALQLVEYDVSAMREDEITRGLVPIKRTGDAAHLQEIHRVLFEKIYDWAGQIREVGMSKDGIAFATPDRIGIYLNDIGRVVRDTPWKNLDRDDVVTNAARVYALANVAHPFREGNGRAMKVFVNQIVEPSGYEFNWNGIDKAVWDQQSKFSMPNYGEHEPHPNELEPVFDNIVRPIPASVVAARAATASAARAAQLAGRDHPTTARDALRRPPTPGARPTQRRGPDPGYGRDTDYGR